MAKKIECLIIGSGPAGYTAAIYAARADLNPVMYTGLEPGGQLTTTTDVDNFPGYSDGVTGPEMMVDLQKQAERFGTEVRFGTVTKVNFSKKKGGYHKLIVNDSTKIEALTVIISTGATARYLGLPSEEKFKGRGVSACATCDGFFFKGQNVAVVGGGDVAAEETTYLAKICPKVYMFIRKDHFRASKAMANRVLNTENINVMFNTEVEEILGDKTVGKVRVFNNQTGEKTELDIQGFFVAIGHVPNTQLFKGIIDMDQTNYIITKNGSTETNIPGVFASGDVQDKVYRQAVTAAGTGCMAALDAERYIGTLSD